LQTMLLISVTGNQLGRRLDHEMSDILQGTMVTVSHHNTQLIQLARRNSVMFEDNTPLVAKRNATDQQKWKDWVRRECIKRFAHFIFINDTQHACLYGHQGVMSVWEMRLAMPCSDALWTAQNAQEWRCIIAEERKTKPLAGEHPPTLLDIVTAFVSRNTTGGVDFRNTPLDGLGLYSVIHGIFSIAWHHKNRKIPQHWKSTYVKVEEQSRFDDDPRWLLAALHDWKTRYNMFWNSAHYPLGWHPPSGMWSAPFRLAAAAIYNLACIWVQAPISDIQMAAGSHFAQGRPVSKYRAQQAWVRINKTVFTDDVAHHGLNLVETELMYKNESTGQPGTHSYLTDPSYPLFMPFVAYLGGLSLWAYTSSVERQIWNRPLMERQVLDQAGFPLDSYLASEFSQGNTTPQFADVNDESGIIRTLRENLSLSVGNADNISASIPTPASAFFSKSDGTTNSRYADNSPARLTMFKQGTGILLGRLRDQMDGHRWEIAKESFEILHGTTNRTANRGDYQ
jgi:Fungal specific transcription factor domain